MSKIYNIVTIFAFTILASNLLLHAQEEIMLISSTSTAQGTILKSGKNTINNNLHPQNDSSSKILDGSIIVNLSPGESRTWRSVRIGTAYTFHSYWRCTVSNLPIFMSFQILQVAFEQWPGYYQIKVDVTLFAASDAIPGNYQADMVFEFSDTPGGTAMITSTLHIDLTISALTYPTNLSAITKGGSHVELTWEDNSQNENGFKIERKNRTEAFEEIASTGADVTSYSDTDVNANIQYTYRIYAYSDQGTSIYSNEATAFTNYIKHIIGNEFNGASTACSADMDGDGDFDIIAGADFANEIAWWENNGSQVFEKHIISDDYRNPTCISTKDIDGDGDLDILSACWSNSGLAWWENDGSQNFQKHTLNIYVFSESACLDDIDNDGDIDIISCDVYNNRVSFWENDGAESFTRHFLDTEFEDVTSVCLADFEGDGDLDILAAGGSYSVGEIAWYENDGSGGFTKNTVSANYLGGCAVFAVDLDTDSDIDIVSAAGFHTDELSWWENDGSQNFTKHTLVEDFDGIRCICAADIDLDSDVDIMVSADPFFTSEIILFENDGSENFVSLKINEDFDGVSSISAFDLDNDGDFDIVGSAKDADEIAWLENIVIPLRIHRFAENKIPEQFVLSQNYPNPFNPLTTLKFIIPKSEDVTLKVYNILGEEVATLVNSKLQAGNHTFQFDGNNLSSGIYFYRIHAGEFQDVKKMILIK